MDDQIPQKLQSQTIEIKDNLLSERSDTDHLNSKRSLVNTKE